MVNREGVTTAVKDKTLDFIRTVAELYETDDSAFKVEDLYQLTDKKLKIPQIRGVLSSWARRAWMTDDYREAMGARVLVRVGTARSGRYKFVDDEPAARDYKEHAHVPVKSSGASFRKTSSVIPSVAPKTKWCDDCKHMVSIYEHNCVPIKPIDPVTGVELPVTELPESPVTSNIPIVVTPITPVDKPVSIPGGTLSSQVAVPKPAWYVEEINSLKAQLADAKALVTERSRERDGALAACAATIGERDKARVALNDRIKEIDDQNKAHTVAMDALYHELTLAKSEPVQQPSRFESQIEILHSEGGAHLLKIEGELYRAERFTF